jgi:hypothetical protein
MNDPLTRVVDATALPASEVYDVLSVDYNLTDIVTQDVKHQNDPDKGINEDQRQILYEDPWAWRDELIKIMQNVEMSLTSAGTRISNLSSYINALQGDFEFEIITEEGPRDLPTLLLSQAEARNRRVGSVRFLHALESKLIEAKAVVRSLS